MIRIEFQEPDTPEWRAWKKDAAAATAEAIRAVQNGEKPEINEALYKRMKDLFAKASFGKCAYCETKIWKTDQPGDVEHFRPKGRIIDDNGKPVVLPEGSKKPHPGYYWLPYDWKNLLLACKLCNSPMKDETGKTKGKWDRFPVADEFRATRPGEEINEKPLFLHPVFDSPEDHFEFDEKTGILGSKTPRAKACLEILGLNRDGLIEGRQDAYRSVLARASQTPNMTTENSILDELSFLEAYRRGEKPYALAGRKALKVVSARLKRVIDSIG
ncbi:MAG: hypothetical protein PHP88_01250 [bacterium]|nr:hypothetical protein [bacterium]